MSEICFRPVTEEDYPAMIELLKESWDFSFFFRDRAAREVMYTDYLYRCLKEITWGEAAYADGELAGFLTGAVRGRKRITDQKRLAERMKETRSRLVTYMRRDENNGVGAAGNAGKFYEQAVAKLPDTVNGRIELFLVAKKFRRRGIGKRLLRRFETYLRQCSAGGCYVETDSMCDYRFYDRQGFRRTDRKRFSLGERGTITLYLYMKELPEGETSFSRIRT